jgi:hypothetical protein
MEDLTRHYGTFWTNGLLRLKSLLETSGTSIEEHQLQNKNNMKNQNYSATIEVSASPRDVFAHINDISNWWATPAFKGEFEGQSTKLNDEFIVRFGGMHYSKQKLIVFIPDNKVVWIVTESLLNWIERDKEEWTGTKMIFELTTKEDQTVLNFTHEGLVPEAECYTNCVSGWDMLIKDRLYNYLNHAEF